MNVRVLNVVMVCGLMLGSMQSFAGSSSNCVSNERDISKVSAIQKFVNNLGGIAALEGQWKLSGIEAMFANVELYIKSGADGIKAEVTGLDGVKPGYGAVTVCSTSTAGVLKVTVNSKATLYMHQTNDGISIAQVKGNESPQYHNFTKQ